MERGEEMSQISQVLDVEPLRSIPPADDQSDDDLMIITSPPPGEMVSVPLTTIASSSSSSGVGPSKRSRQPNILKGSNKKCARMITSIPNFQGAISEENQENGNHEVVRSLMWRFDAVRRRLSQVETLNGAKTTITTTFKCLGLRTNAKRRVGEVPGVDPGVIFYEWGEMAIVGLHGAPIGIDYIGKKESGDKEKKPLAICVVNSGENADGDEDPDSLILTGQGGTEKYGPPRDQKIERGNLALQTSLRRQSGVRVIRTVRDKTRKLGKVYIYDGIYSITSMWEENGGKHGFKIFKFKMDRNPNQKPAFEIWKSIDVWKKGLITREGILLHDLSNGAENLKVSLVNEVDGDKGLEFFRYITSLNHSLTSVEPRVFRCDCSHTKSCGPGDDCLCIRRNGGELPYIDSLLVTRRPMVYECGSSCPCPPDCKNRMFQTGLRFCLEVFKTEGCGWGLRSLDPIRAGSFICEYAGEVIKKGEEDKEDDYVFDTSRVYTSFQWNYEPELVGEVASEKIPEEFDIPKPLVISAKNSGNVARFMNHSCSPNVLWQPIICEEKGKLCIHIGFFAMKHIPPLEELRFDYGKSQGSGKHMCLCGSTKCNGSFG